MPSMNKRRMGVDIIIDMVKDLSGEGVNYRLGRSSFRAGDKVQVPHSPH